MWLSLTILFLLYPSFKIYQKLTKRWCSSNKCLAAKTAIVTGANSGIGFETAIDFAKRGARVILACRDAQRASEAHSRIIEETGNDNIVVKTIDMASFDSVRNFARDINTTESRLDILVNNAGICFVPEGFQDADEHDFIMKVNHYSPFLLTNLLLELMKKTGNSRIVNVASIGAKWCKDFQVENMDQYVSDKESYWKSKLCNIFFTKELAKRLEGTSVTTYSLHPGLVRTELTKGGKGWGIAVIQLLILLFAKASREGAQTTLHCALAKGIEQLSGEHFADCKRVDSYQTASDILYPKKVWEATERIVNLK